MAELIHNPKARFGISAEEARQVSFALSAAPPLPAVNYGLVGKTAPTVSKSSAGLPKATAVVITWAEAEWAALQQVFSGSTTAMPYSDRSRAAWPAWTKYADHLPSGAPSSWTYWGYYCLVEVSGKPVLLFKSNTHLDGPGPTYLQDMINLLISQVKPDLILSIGTAGGAQPTDHVGTVRAVNAGTLYESGVAQSSWPFYKNAWSAPTAILGAAQFKQLLFAIPATKGALQTLCAQFNSQYGTKLALSDLDPDGLNLPDPVPKVANDTAGGSPGSLLTTPTFVVATTAGNYASYACVEMDDAIIAKACSANGVPFGFVRNVSDPAQGAALPAKVQGNWGSAVYDTYGFYTSYNGALAAWAMLA